MVDGIRISDVVQTELEQLERYGEAAREFFHQLTGEIKEEFSSSLNGLLSSELANFQSQVSQSGLGTGGYTDLGTLAGNVLGGFIPNDAFGNIFGTAIKTAVRTAVRDLVRTGSIDIGKVVTAADRSGSAAYRRTGVLHLSPGQQAAETLATITRGQRNT